MYSTDFGFEPTTVAYRQEAMRELTAQELNAIGGGRTRSANPDLLTEPPPHVEK